MDPEASRKSYDPPPATRGENIELSTILGVLANASLNAVAYFDRELRPFFANQVFRLSEEALTTASLPSLRRALDGERVEASFALGRPEDPAGVRWYVGRYVPDRGAPGDGAVRGCAVVIADVTELKRGEERAAELSRARAFVDSLIENLPNMVFVKSAAELKFVRFNRAGEELLGYSRDDLLGKSDYDFFPPAQADAFIAKDRAVLMGNRIVDIPREPIQTKHLGDRILHTKKIPLVGADGRPEYLLGISEDITDQVNAEQARLQRRIDKVREQVAVETREAEARRMTFLADASTLLASSLDYHATLKRLAGLAVPELGDWATVTMVTQKGELERLAAVHADPAKAAWIDELDRTYPARSERTDGAAEVIATGRSRFVAEVTDEMLQASARDARHLEMMRRLGCTSCMLVPISARGKVLGVISFVSGSRARLFGAEDLAVAEELGRRAGIAVDNALLYEAARLAVRSRDDFMSIASHELKTPITSLKLKIQMTRRKIRPPRDADPGFMPEPSKLLEVLETSERQVDRLTHLVNDLLDVSRIQAGKMGYTPEPVDLAELVRQVIEGQPQIALQGEVAPLQASCDRFRIEQVIVNLVSNAVKYGEGRPVTIVLERFEVDARPWVRIAVRDQGMGVPAEMREKIFERFERAVSHHNISGLGLGLYIVRSIVQAHGGTVRVEAPAAGGSHFIVEIPREPPRETPPTAASAQNQEKKA